MPARQRRAGTLIWTAMTMQQKCGQNQLDSQNPSSYTPNMKREFLVNPLTGLDRRGKNFLSRRLNHHVAGKERIWLHH